MTHLIWNIGVFWGHSCFSVKWQSISMCKKKTLIWCRSIYNSIKLANNATHGFIFVTYNDICKQIMFTVRPDHHSTSTRFHFHIGLKPLCFEISVEMGFPIVTWFLRLKLLSRPIQLCTPFLELWNIWKHFLLHQKAFKLFLVILYCTPKSPQLWSYFNWFNSHNLLNSFSSTQINWQ